MVRIEEAKELVKQLKKGKIKESEFVERICPTRRKYPIGHTRYEVILYRDIRTDEGWDTIDVVVVDKTEDIKQVKKIIPNAEKLIEQEEAIQNLAGDDENSEIEDDDSKL